MLFNCSTLRGDTQTRISVRISNTATLAGTEVSKFQGDCLWSDVRPYKFL